MGEWWKKYEGLIPGIEVFFPEENWIELKTSKNIHIQTYRYSCPNPRAILFIFHAMGSQANYMAHIARRFAEENILVLAMDQECHGKSGGTPGRATDIVAYVDTSALYVEKARELYPNLPVFALGESLGGFISVLLSLRMSLTGMILLAPAVALSEVFNNLPSKLLRFTARMMPWLRTGVPDFSLITRNVHLEHACIEDPSIFTDKGYLGNVDAVAAAFEYIMPLHSKVTTPFFMIQGGMDKICEASLAKKFVAATSSLDKRLLLVEDMEHMVSLEDSIYELMEKMVKWTNERIS